MNFFLILFFSFGCFLHPAKKAAPQKSVENLNVQKVVPAVSIIPFKKNLVDAQHELEMGISLPTSGGVAFLGSDYLAGVNLVFNKFNKSGDSNYLLRIAPLDDKYDMSLSLKNINTLLKKSPLFFGLFGVNGFMPAADVIQQRKMAILFPITGSAKTRNADLVGVVNWRASLEEELQALIDYSIKKLCKDKIAVFYEEGPWGNEGLEAVKDLLKKRQLEPVAVGSYSRGTVAIDKAAGVISKAIPTAVVCISHTRATYAFIQSLINGGLSTCSFLGVSELIPLQRRLKKSRGVSIVLSQVVPDPEKSDLPIAQRFRDDVKKYLPKLIPNLGAASFALEGYICATFLVEVLKTLEPPFTVETIIKAFEDKTKIDLGGISLGFDPRKRQFSRNIWLTGEEGAWKLAQQAA